MQALTQSGKRFTDAELWQAVASRDRSLDRVFVYGVRSTGIYCRPACPSRRPKRELVVFFSKSAAAERAGFRPCLRCRPQQAEANNSAKDVVAKVCRFIDAHVSAPNGGKLHLAELGRISGYSPFHLQRTFKQVLGLSPRQYAETRRMSQLKSQLRKGNNVTTATYEAGFGSSSRIYEHANGHLGMTPATYGHGGRGMSIRYAIANSPLGRMLAAATDRGICSVKFGDSDDRLFAALQEEFSAAEIKHDGGNLGGWLKQILEAITRGADSHLPLDLRCTAFQRQVWEALRAIPQGTTRSYSQIAATVGRPAATRAVARACASNPVAVLVPCHRVVRSDGQLGGYRWGIERKKRLLKNEQQASANSVN
jgi:AraC family transcriptional regulator of adaptative response/methylated-DNA-[protein]-cysteine methyltransferase